LSSKWLHDTVSFLWGLWLPDESKETIKKGGYYSHLVTSSLKVIGLNMNYCYNFNW
jgi:sphingomyelin phosphodiesterase